VPLFAIPNLPVPGSARGALRAAPGRQVSIADGWFTVSHVLVWRSRCISRWARLHGGAWPWLHSWAQ
jgi:hypothetical protein